MGWIRLNQYGGGRVSNFSLDAIANSRFCRTTIRPNADYRRGAGKIAQLVSKSGTMKFTVELSNICATVFLTRGISLPPRFLLSKV